MSQNKKGPVLPPENPGDEQEDFSIKKKNQHPDDPDAPPGTPDRTPVKEPDPKEPPMGDPDQDKKKRLKE